MTGVHVFFPLLCLFNISQQYGWCSFHDPIDHISFGVVVVFTRGQIEDSRVWRLMRLMSVMMMSVMMHNSDLRDSGEYKKKKVWGVQIFTMQSIARYLDW